MRFFQTESGRSPVEDFIAGLPVKIKAAISADLAMIESCDGSIPVQQKMLKGHAPMMQLTVGGYRVMFVRTTAGLFILAACKKDDQANTIKIAAKRMRAVQEGK